MATNDAIRTPNLGSAKGVGWSLANCRLVILEGRKSARPPEVLEVLEGQMAVSLNYQPTRKQIKTALKSSHKVPQTSERLEQQFIRLDSIKLGQMADCEVHFYGRLKVENLENTKLETQNFSKHIAV